jgi:hypothetical protein
MDVAPERPRPCDSESAQGKRRRRCFETLLTGNGQDRLRFDNTAPADVYRRG